MNTALRNETSVNMYDVVEVHFNQGCCLISDLPASVFGVAESTYHMQSLHTETSQVYLSVHYNHYKSKSTENPL